MELTFEIKEFEFKLQQILKTSRTNIVKKKGFVLKIKTKSGEKGWGEISSLDNSKNNSFKSILKSIDSKVSKSYLEELIASLSGPIAFGLGSAIAEIDEKILKGTQKWSLKPPLPCELLIANQSSTDKISMIIQNASTAKDYLSLKYKLGINSIEKEKQFIDKILKILPNNIKLRLDANGGWTMNEAKLWIDYFKNEPRLEWFEQPLPANQIKELTELSESIPVALDESLFLYPQLRNEWKSWQIRRPALEGDPRLILEELKNGKKKIAISTAFETGIGRRCINHLAAIQYQSKTPAAPGLAPGWRPKTSLFSTDPEEVWQSL